jgi:hypothetical protein
MNLLYPLRPRQNETVIKAVLAVGKVLRLQVEALDLGAHRPVEQEHSLLCGL